MVVPFHTPVAIVPTAVNEDVTTPLLRTVPVNELELYPVQFVKTPLVGVPSKGVTKVGLVANTNDPLPVSSVTAVAKLALDGVPRKVATPAPKEVIPVPP